MVAHVCHLSSFGRLRQENHDFQASLGYTQRTCFEKQKLVPDQEIVSQTGDPGNTYSRIPHSFGLATLILSPQVRTPVIATLSLPYSGVLDV